MPFGQYNESRVWHKGVNFVGPLAALAGISFAEPAPLTYRYDILYARNNDVVPHTLRFNHDAGSGESLPDIVVPSGAGWNGTAALDVLAAWGFPPAQQFLLIGGSDALDIVLVEALLATFSVEVAGMGGTFPENL
jgi:hypothetical protein